MFSETKRLCIYAITCLVIYSHSCFLLIKKKIVLTTNTCMLKCSLIQQKHCTRYVYNTQDVRGAAFEQDGAQALRFSLPSQSLVLVAFTFLLTFIYPHPYVT